MVLRPNAECSQHWCRKRQAEHKAHLASLPPAVAQADVQSAPVELHPDNEWGIELDDEASSEAAASASADAGAAASSLGADFKYAHEAAAKQTLTAEETVQDQGLDLASLMASLKAVQQ